MSVDETSKDPNKNSEAGQHGKHEKDGILSEIVHKAEDAAKDLFWKSLDPNKYATKKTIAQGLLDVALLTANASQLKYVLQVGEKHEFYALMLSLISLSIVLQVAQAILCLVLGTALDINNQDHHPHADRANNIVLSVNIILMAVNVIISSFEMKGEYTPFI